VKVAFAGSPVELGGLKVVMDHWSQAWGPGLDEGTELSKILFLPQTFVFFFFGIRHALTIIFGGWVWVWMWMWMWCAALR
jgi:hypothetical protein